MPIDSKIFSEFERGVRNTSIRAATSKKGLANLKKIKNPGISPSPLVASSKMPEILNEEISSKPQVFTIIKHIRVKKKITKSFFVILLKNESGGLSDVFISVETLSFVPEKKSIIFLTPK